MVTPDGVEAPPDRSKHNIPRSLAIAKIFGAKKISTALGAPRALFHKI